MRREAEEVQVKIILMRGAPGSGKSYQVRRLYLAYPNLKIAVCSADDYFDVDGQYRFNAKELGAAHSACLAKFKLHVSNNDVDFVIVDNTNSRYSELHPYITASIEAGVTPTVCVMHDNQFENIHNVPHVKVEEMRTRIATSLVLPAIWSQVPVFFNDLLWAAQ